MNLTLMLCLGMAWAGVILLFLAIFAGIQRIVTPQPRVPEARSRWARDWDEIEMDINK